MKDFILTKAITLALPMILGPLAYLVGRYVLNLWNWVDDLPATAKRAVVLAISVSLAMAAQQAGVTLPGECAAIGTGSLTTECQNALAAPAFLKGILGAIIAYAMHSVKKSHPSS